jgi:integrase
MAPKKKPAAKPPRRPPGSGTIYRDGAGYRIVIEIAGREIRERAPTAEAAGARLDELYALKQKGIDVAAGSTPVADWMDVWYQLRVDSKKLKPRALMHLRSLIERYITPMLGHLPLSALTPEIIQRFIFAVRDKIHAKYQREAQARKDAGLPAIKIHDGIKTARDCGPLLDAALELAVNRKILPENPYRGIELPRKPDAPPRRVSIDHLVGQLRSFLAVARTHPLAPLWYSYTLLGLRFGEGLGITWSGLDLDLGEVHIHQQVQEIAKAGDEPMHLVIGTPKTTSGARYLPLPSALWGMYRTAWNDHEVRERPATWVGDQYGLVFCNRDGGPLWPRNVEDEYARLRDQAGLPRTFTPHQLRHAVASLLDTVPGITETIKAEILGHKKATMSLFYTHGTDEVKRRVLEALADLVLGPDLGAWIGVHQRVKPPTEPPMNA